MTFLRTLIFIIFGIIGVVLTIFVEISESTQVYEWIHIPSIVLLALFFNELFLVRQFNNIKICVSADLATQKGHPTKNDAFALVPTSKLHDELLLGNWYNVLYLIMLIATISVTSTIFWLMLIGMPYARIFAISGGIFFIVVLIIFYFFGFNIGLDKGYPSLKGTTLTKETSNTLLIYIFTLTALGFLSLQRYEWFDQRSTIVSLGLLILPTFFITYLEVKFFFLFIVKTWMDYKDWDLITASRKIYNGRTVRVIFAKIFSKLSAIVGLIAILFGVIAAFLSVVEAIVTLFSKGIDDTIIFEYTFTNPLPGPNTIYILILGLGSLVTLTLRPMAFIELWSNKNLYDTIAGRISEHTLTTQMRSKKNYPLFDQKFGISLILITTLIVVFISMTIISNFIAREFEFFIPALWLTQKSASLFFLIMLIYHLFDLSDERNIQRYAHRVIETEGTLLSDT